MENRSISMQRIRNNVKKIKSIMGIRKPLNATDYVKSLDLDDHPFTKALFVRAASLIDASAIEIDVKLPSFESTDITSFAETAKPRSKYTRCGHVSSILGTASLTP